MESDQPLSELETAAPVEPAAESALSPDLAVAAPADSAVAMASAPLPEPVSATDQLLNLLVLGGPVVWILMAMSSVVIAVVLLKLWQLRASGLTQRQSDNQSLELWRRGQHAQAIDLLAGDTRPLPKLLHFAMVGIRAGNAAELLREEVARIALARLEQLRSHLKTLEVIASLSPLLGLFGTVIGMIEAFAQMEAAGSQVDPSVLSGGIWVALLTTAVGLAVAIPTVMAHAWLERKVDAARHRIEDAVTQVFTHQVVAEEPAARLVPISKLHAPA